MKDETQLTENSLTQSPHGRFLEHAARGELAFQRDSTGRAFFPPRLIAPKEGTDPTWDVSVGTGAIHSLTLVRHKGEAPLALAMIDLDEGFRIMSHVDAADPENLRIGDRVKVAFRPLADGQPPMPVFALTEERA
ncbi:Zn-ribbon domain-containing OB-fold protein [Shinella granuli]|uniref:ChsH2 C-terminal OB-fold domain-containing protein n=1 Tax=Shinella granuli TaxID=323621 RepID=A0A4R2C7P8_SHIGR|nr:OB-fold domain-containing protein [Shinella granuli]TCN35422.1 hypothetical protein EV665_12832 [Shinella granuli]